MKPDIMNQDPTDIIAFQTQNYYLVRLPNNIILMRGEERIVFQISFEVWEQELKKTENILDVCTSSDDIRDVYFLAFYLIHECDPFSYYRDFLASDHKADGGVTLYRTGVFLSDYPGNQDFLNRAAPVNFNTFTINERLPGRYLSSLDTGHHCQFSQESVHKFLPLLSKENRTFFINDCTLILKVLDTNIMYAIANFKQRRKHRKRKVRSYNELIDRFCKYRI